MLLRKKNGFTFVELILYMAIVTIILSALIPFAWNIIIVGTKSSTQQEVFSQARFISEKIKSEIRNASDINSVSAGSISLATTAPSTNPTVIDVASGKVRIKLGAGAVTNLNSDDTYVTSLSFTNNSSVDSLTKNITFILNLGDNFTSSRQEFIESIGIRSSVEVRSN